MMPQETISITRKDFDRALREVEADLIMFALIRGKSALTQDTINVLAQFCGLVKDQLFEGGNETDGCIPAGSTDGIGPADI